MNMRRGFWALVALSALVVLGLMVALVYASGLHQLNQVRQVAQALSGGGAGSGARLLAQYGVDEGWVIAQPFVWRLLGIGAAVLGGLALCWALYARALKRRRAQQAARRLDALDKILSGQMPLAVDPRDLEQARLHQIWAKLHQSARRSLEDKRHLQALITDISHQLKTPLSSIRMFSDLLIEGGQTAAEAREFLLRSRAAVARLEWLTGSLMLLSRMEAGLIAIRPKDCDLYQTVAAAADALRHKAEEKGMALTTRGAKLIVAHDPRWTGEAVHNLIDNAIKYGRHGGHVRVAVADLGTAVRVDVTDDGPGVAPDEVNRIFRRFARGAAAEASGAEGAGVGLYLCRAIFEAQSGSVVVEPTPGGGATFRAFLTKLSSSAPSVASQA